MFDYEFNYSAFRDGELLFLASRIDALMPDDQLALKAELRKRGLDVPLKQERGPTIPLAGKIEVVRTS